jgi:hypothetical protein
MVLQFRTSPDLAEKLGMDVNELMRRTSAPSTPLYELAPCLAKVFPNIADTEPQRKNHYHALAPARTPVRAGVFFALSWSKCGPKV